MFYKAFYRAFLSIVTAKFSIWFRANWERSAC